MQRDMRDVGGVQFTVRSMTKGENKFLFNWREQCPSECGPGEPGQTKQQIIYINSDTDHKN